MRGVHVKAALESIDAFSLWHQPVFTAVPLFTTQGLHKFSKECICSQLRAHRWSAATSQLMGSNPHSCSNAVIWNMAGQGPVQNAIPRTVKRSLFKHWHQQKIVTLCKGPRSLVLVPLLGIDGAGGQHHPQPQDPSATPGERLAGTCKSFLHSS